MSLPGANAVLRVGPIFAARIWPLSSHPAASQYFRPLLCQHPAANGSTKVETPKLPLVHCFAFRWATTRAYGEKVSAGSSRPSSGSGSNEPHPAEQPASCRELADPATHHGCDRKPRPRTHVGRVAALGLPPMAFNPIAAPNGHDGVCGAPSPAVGSEEKQIFDQCVLLVFREPGCRINPKRMTGALYLGGLKQGRGPVSSDHHATKVPVQ